MWSELSTVIALVGVTISVVGWVFALFRVTATAARIAGRFEESAIRLERAVNELSMDVRNLLDVSARQDERHQALERRVARLESE